MGGEARRVAATGKVETAHGLGQRIRAILVHAVDRVDIESHLGAGLSRVLPAVEKTPVIGASKIVVSGRLENRWHRNCVAVHEDQWLSVTSGYAARKPLL